MPLPPDVADTQQEDEPQVAFDPAIGQDLRSLRAGRRQAAMELLLTIAGALLAAALGALMLMKW